MTQKPLMKYRVNIQAAEDKTIETWGVYPITNDTKIIDGIYEPESKSLRLMFDSVTENLKPKYVQNEKNQKWEEVLRRGQDYYRGSITNEEDIKFFLENYVDNNFEFIPEDKKLILT